MELLTEPQRALFVHGGQLDDYEVLKPIGKGKFSVVYKAKRRHDGQTVALKKIAIFDLMNVKAREKTLKEVRLVQSVCHPNIIQYLDAFVQDNELHIAFEWAEAGDLKRQIRKANEKGVHFDERTIWRYFTQLCGAIRYLHQARIMHRDLKPANIFLTLKGVVKLGDLGLSRYLSENTMEARSKVGTPLYMSPEVLRGESYDWKSDVWSMGCILYELAMLRSPFKSEGLNLVGLFQKINKGEYEEMPDMYSDYLRELVKRMISLHASDRPSVQQVWEFCQARPSSAALQERMQQNQTTVENYDDRTDEKCSIRSQTSKRIPAPEAILPLQQDPLSNNVPSAQQHNSRETIEVIRRKDAETRMELLFERLRILRYDKVLHKRISRIYFASDSQTLPTILPQSRFEDMCTLASWLLTLLSGEAYRNSEELPIVKAQKILLSAEKVGVSSVADLNAAALTRGVGVQVCELLDALTAAVMSRKAYNTAPPVYPKDPVETIVSCDALNATDEDEQSEGSDKTGESTTSLVIADEDDFSHWVVDKGESECSLQANGGKNDVMIHTTIDPIAWELEQRRVLPKLQEVLNNRLQQLPAESSWRVRLSHVQAQAEVIDAVKDSTQQDIGQIQAILRKQTAQFEAYEKLLNKRHLRARRLYHEGITSFATSHGTMLTALENVNRATIEVARLETARVEQANALQAANARLTDNSMVLERKRHLRQLVDENRKLGLKLQVLQDVLWRRKQKNIR